MTNQPEPSLRDYLRGKSFKIGFAATGPDKGYLTDESIDELFALFQDEKEAAVREARQHEIRNAVKAGAISDSYAAHRMALVSKVDIPLLTHPQAGEGEGK